MCIGAKKMSFIDRQKLLICVMAIVAVAAGCTEKTPHTEAEVQPYIREVTRIQERRRKLLANSREGKITPGEALRQEEKMTDELKQIRPPWEFKKYHDIQVKISIKEAEVYELQAEGEHVPASLKNQQHRLARLAIRELLFAENRLKEE